MRPQAPERPPWPVLIVDDDPAVNEVTLDLARHIRDELHNRTVRIVLRTGEARMQPMVVVDQYEIDDFRAKTDLTFERMTILVKSSLRTYGLLRELERALGACNEELRATRA
jgi:hypothetical protein